VTQWKIDTPHKAGYDNKEYKINLCLLVPIYGKKLKNKKKTIS